MGKLYVIGIGPGGLDHMTLKAKEARKKWCNSWIYKVYRYDKTSYRR